MVLASSTYEFFLQMMIAAAEAADEETYADADEGLEPGPEPEPAGPEPVPEPEPEPEPDRAVDGDELLFAREQAAIQEAAQRRRAARELAAAAAVADPEPGGAE
jgi:hypothetical protein